PTINDRRNIEMLVSKANTTEGALQAIQAGNNILGQMALTLVEIRNVLGKSVVVASAVAEETRQTVMTSEARDNAELENYKMIQTEAERKSIKDKEKYRKEKINVNWRGI
ncbi:MAG: hypothetical protein ACRDDH_17010, partial [Cetobacterium sp.]|uniref:hypothetical protein n=1 Tax=Cetobacterium sp. TaxID=2071632 RepID=UPI003EE5FDDF